MLCVSNSDVWESHVTYLYDTGPNVKQQQTQIHVSLLQTTTHNMNVHSPKTRLEFDVSS